MSGYVYLIGNHDHDIVKIGYTSKPPQSRLKSLQTGCPVKLEILGFMDGGQELEQSLHITFAPMHLHGEWFRMDGKLSAFVMYFDEPCRATIAAPENRLTDAIFDNVLCDWPPHPAIDPQEWVSSADPTQWEFLRDEAS